MTAIPLLRGIVSTPAADFSLSYPINLEPVPTETGFSKGYLRSAAGVRQVGTGPGIMRGAIAWKGTLYAVMGTSFVSIAADGVVTTLGNVGGTGPVALDYGFDRLGIQSGTSLYYWNGTALNKVTDPDLGQCLDMIWMDGFFVSTDGTSVVTTQLSDPSQIDPNKYGSAESDPDPVAGLIRCRNELYVGGSHTIEVFSNAGGSGFPFQRSSGATIPKGWVGARAKTLFGQTFAFCGAGRNEAVAVWQAGAGTATKLSTRAVDDDLAGVADTASIILEARTSRDEQRLFVHLPDRTWCYLANASQAASEAVWYVAQSGVDMRQPFRPRFATLAYGRWFVGDAASSAIGELDEGVSGHFGEDAGWQFDTMLIHNGGRGAIVHDLELIGLPGRGGEGTAYLSFTEDGEAWTQERACLLPAAGNKRGRVAWRPHKRIRNLMGCRFRGSGDQLAGFASLEARIEPLK